MKMDMVDDLVGKAAVVLEDVVVFGVDGFGNGFGDRLLVGVS